MRLRVRRLPELKQNERELLRLALLRLPRMPENGNAEVEQLRRDGHGDFEVEHLLRDAPRGDPEVALRIFCDELDRMRLMTGNQFVSIAKHRKPVVWTVTVLAAVAYKLTTGKPVTRISKYVSGANGKQEAGAFAKFLAEVFDIVGIKASAAGQARKLLDSLHDNSISLHDNSIT